jgi:uridine phosphorylase
MAAFRLDGTGKQCIEAEYPAAASHGMTLALIETAERLSKKCRVGYTASADDFYAGQRHPWVGGYLPPQADKLVERLRRQNVLTMEM